MIQAVNIIFKNPAGKTLLQMRDGMDGIMYPLTWGLWGGAMEPEDMGDYRKTAAREAEEELGVAFSPEAFYLLTERPLRNGLTGYIVGCDTRLDWGDFKVLEGAGAAFFSHAEITKLPTSHNIQWLLDHKPEVFG